jgi:hypothetical protein
MEGTEVDRESMVGVIQRTQNISYDSSCTLQHHSPKIPEYQKTTELLTTKSHKILQKLYVIFTILPHNFSPRSQISPSPNPPETHRRTFPNKIDSNLFIGMKEIIELLNYIY